MKSKLSSLFILASLLLPIFISSQNKVTVKKNTIEGFFRSDIKPFSYLYFDKEGNAVILSKNYKKKRALGVVIDCVQNSNCKDCRLMKYTMDTTNTILFGFETPLKNTTHFTEYRVKSNLTNPNLVMKISKTNLPVEVKNFYPAKL